VSTCLENLEKIKKKIRECSPYPELVRIEAVTKLQDAKKVTEAIQLGIQILGVNYIQEGQSLRLALGDQKAAWHFIGHIQSRKVKFLTEYDCVESIDRIEIAEALNRRALDLHKKIKVLVQVNIGREPQKSGVFPEQLEAFVNHLRCLEALQVSGLMAMPPALPLEARRPFFKSMRKWFVDLGFKDSAHSLSMGTSDDYEVALQEGALLIRLGTLIFGERVAQRN